MKLGISTPLANVMVWSWVLLRCQRICHESANAPTRRFEIRCPFVDANQKSPSSISGTKGTPWYHPNCADAKRINATRSSIGLTRCGLGWANTGSPRHSPTERDLNLKHREIRVIRVYPCLSASKFKPTGEFDLSCSANAREAHTPALRSLADDLLLRLDASIA